MRKTKRKYLRKSRKNNKRVTKKRRGRSLKRRKKMCGVGDDGRGVKRSIEDRSPQQIVAISRRDGEYSGYVKRNVKLRGYVKRNVKPRGYVKRNVKPRGKVIIFYNNQNKYKGDFRNVNPDGMGWNNDMRENPITGEREVQNPITGKWSPEIEYKYTGDESDESDEYVEVDAELDVIDEENLLGLGLYGAWEGPILIKKFIMDDHNQLFGITIEDDLEYILENITDEVDELNNRGISRLNYENIPTNIDKENVRYQ